MEKREIFTETHGRKDMGYKIDVEKLKWSVAFVDQDIWKERNRIALKDGLKGEIEKKEKELQKLIKKRETLKEKREEARLAQEMFAFGGETVATKDPVKQKMNQLESQISACRRRIRELRRENTRTETETKFLADAEFLDAQTKQIWNRLAVNGNQMEASMPQEGCGALEKWERASAAPVLQVKALLFQTFFRWRTPQWEEEALRVFQTYQSRPEIQELPLNREKAAFLAAKPQQLLKQVIRETTYGTPEGLKSKMEELNVALLGLPLEDAPYPGLVLYRKLTDAGWANGQTLRFLGQCCHYLSVNKKDEYIFVNQWQKWFGEAMESEACHRAMQGILEMGFADFLRLYGEDKGKCMGKILGNWKDQPRFSEYAPAFQREIVRYMEEPGYIERAWGATWNVPQKYPLLKSLDPDDRYGTARRQLVTFYTEEIAKNWLAMDLVPERWDPDQVENCIKKIIFYQLQLYVDGKKNYSSETLGRQLSCYFAEVMDRGVWDEALDAKICGMLKQAVGSGFRSPESQKVKDNLKVLAEFKGKRRFRPYEKLLEDEARRSIGTRSGTGVIRPAQQAMERDFRIRPGKSVKFWIMMLLSVCMGTSAPAYFFAGLILAILLISDHRIWYREVLAVGLAFLAGLAGAYLLGGPSLLRILIKGWQMMEGKTFYDFLSCFGFLFATAGAILFLAVRRAGEEKKRSE